MISFLKSIYFKLILKARLFWSYHYFFDNFFLYNLFCIGISLKWSKSSFVYIKPFFIIANNFISKFMFNNIFIFFRFLLFFIIFFLWFGLRIFLLVVILKVWFALRSIAIHQFLRSKRFQSINRSIRFWPQLHCFSALEFSF